MRPGTLRTTLLMLVLAVGCVSTARLERDAKDEAASADKSATAGFGNAGGPAESRPMAVVATASPTPGAPFSSFDPGFGSGMIIRTGTASIEIDSLEKGIARIQALADRVGGYLANSEIQAGGERYRNATLEVKVPSSQFDALLRGLEPIGKLEQVNVAAQDVGEEYTDLSARVTNARRLEQRLIELLATRTGKLSDVLEIERELARVREEIERMEGRLRFLKARSAISTLTISVHEPLPLVGEEGSASVLAEAFRQAWRNFVSLMAGVIASLGVLLPALSLIPVVVLLTRRWRERRSA